MDLKNIFDNHFKFQTDERVRHKGDGSNHGSADLKMLITGRYLEEVIGDGETTIYQKFYKCRCIKFSGSGQEIYFKEHELLSISEWQQLMVKEEAFRNENRDSFRKEFKAVYDFYGVTKKSHLKVKGSDKLFKITGLSGTSKKGVYELHIEEIVTDNSFNKERRYISNKEDISEVVDPPENSLNS